MPQSVLKMLPGRKLIPACPHVRLVGSLDVCVCSRFATLASSLKLVRPCCFTFWLCQLRWQLLLQVVPVVEAIHHIRGGLMRAKTCHRLLRAMEMTMRRIQVI